MVTRYAVRLIFPALLVAAAPAVPGQPVADKSSTATTSGGEFIRWREHIIDDPEIAGFFLSGSDGLVMADIDRDGFEDIVSVHEFDSSYDSATYDDGIQAPADGHVRIAFGSADPERWVNITVAEGLDAAAPEDAAIADVNGDGYPDIMVAAELSHLIYLENPGPNARNSYWNRLILPMTKGRGSYIRVFMADLDGDGTPEVIAPNKGAQRPGPEDFAVSNPVSIFRVSGDPLEPDSWNEIVLGYYSVPQNSEPVDLDSDGDQDIVVGSRGENRLVFFENLGSDALEFREHAIGINGTFMAGFNLEFTDLNGDGRLDIIGATPRGLSWIEQPARRGDAWNSHFIGTFEPDSMTGMETADIDGDGDIDIIAGSYSRGDRENDGNISIDSPLGRLGWFENPGDASGEWQRHDISRRKRGMFDKFIARDADGDGDVDFFGTRGNSAPYDGVFWLEQVRSRVAAPVFLRARNIDSEEVPLPDAGRP